ncbi:MAG: hypothetical protein AABW57_01375 [Nanoarchaeota archaeon]
MKKLTLILILLFLIPFVSAEINVLNQIEQIYNINERIPLKIVVTYDQELEGYVKSSVICDNAKLDYFVSPITLKISPQEINIPDLRLTKNMIGKCSLEVSLTNDQDILLDKNVVKIFEVSDNLILTVNLNKDKLSPNDELKMNGDIKNVRGQLLDKGQVKILLDDQEFSTELNKGEFSYTYQIPADVKSNSHPLKISLEDGYGNKASKEFSIFINPKPTMLKTLLNKIDFLPEDKVSIESLLYDQADDLIENNAEIKVFDPENELVKQSNSKIEFTLDQYALPGTWLIKTSTDNFKIESKFNVKEVKKVQTYVEDGVLYVKNVGNVPFDDEIQVQAIGEDGKEFTKKINIDPKESKIIKLSNELLQGKYDLNVLANDQKESFDNVSVPEKDDPLYLTGKSVETATNKLIDQPYLIILIVLIIVLIFYFSIKIKKDNRFRREKETQLGYMRAREIEQGKIKQGIKPRRFNINEKEAKDFTNRMLKNIDREKRNNEDYLRKPPKDDKPGLFGMFD